MNIIYINCCEFITQYVIGTLSSATVLFLGYWIAYEKHLKKKFQEYVKVDLENQKKLNEVGLKNKELIEHGFVKSWNNQKEAESQLLKDMKESHKIDVFTTRGGTFSNTDNNEIAKCLFSDNYLKKRILLSHPDNLFLVKRQDELQNAKKEDISNLKIEVKASYDKLVQKFGNDSIKQHKENPVRYRSILLDNCMYISQQLPDKCSQESPIAKYNKDSFWYPILSAEFEGFWEKNENKIN